MAKQKKKQHRKDPATPVALDGDEFPTEIVVELWHKPDKGKRALVGSRRYVLTPDLAESTSEPESSTTEPKSTTTEPESLANGDPADGAAVASPKPTAARPAPARKRPRTRRRATKPSA